MSTSSGSRFEKEQPEIVSRLRRAIDAAFRSDGRDGDYVDMDHLKMVLDEQGVQLTLKEPDLKV